MSNFEGVPGKNRPKNSKWRQQELPAWQPVLQPKNVLPVFIVTGIVFIPLGAVLLSVSNDVIEIEHDYTTCKPSACYNGTVSVTPTPTSAADFVKDAPDGIHDVYCKCEITLDVPKDMSGSVVVMYGLENYHQNHRLYVRSRNDRQLLGNLNDENECEPFDKAHTDSDYPVVPCGAIANSLFSDKFELKKDKKKVVLTKNDIAWKTDKIHRFKNPSCSSDNWQETFAHSQKPKAWLTSIANLSGNAPCEENALQDPDLMVWMRAAAFPTFRKLHRRVDLKNSGFSDGVIPAKTKFDLTVTYRYPVAGFGGKKKFILTTTSALGGKNPFLGIAYIVVGCLCLVAGVVLGLVHHFCRNGVLDGATSHDDLLVH